MLIINMIRGFFMALADSVPGVSGGTIAFIMGFYDDFIDAINTLMLKGKEHLEKKKEAVFFLGKLGIGWIIGLGLSVLVLASIFESEIYKISSVFIGFIIFSIPLIIKEESPSLKKNYFNGVFTLIGIGLVFMITFLNGQLDHSELSFDNFSLYLGIYVFISGMIAISAMVLPGVSGSTILLIFGLYTSIIFAIKETLTFNFKYIPILFIFGLGVLTGVFSIIRLLRYLLTNYRSQVIYFIIGLMVGSLYAVFMGPTTLETPKAAMTLQSFNLFFFLLGGLVIFGLDEMKRYLNKDKITLEKK